MASEEDLGQSRTEAATPRRREEARAEGRVAFSADLTTGLLLLCGVTVLMLAGPSLAAQWLDSVRTDLQHPHSGDLGAVESQQLLTGVMHRGLGMIGYLLAVMLVAGVSIPVLQVGFHIAPGLLGLKPERLSPAQGWSKLLSGGGGVKALTSVLKLTCVVGAAYWALRGRRTSIGGLHELPLSEAVGQAWSLVFRVALAAVGMLVALGVADYAYQRWNLEQSLMMTRQEIKDEMKRDEGDPQVKARIRKLQRDKAQSQMMQEVPQATVVITNPTHLAVALRYETGVMGAPRVVAKGAGLIAQRIAAKARQHGVPVLERKPLAQALFKTAVVGQEIPAGLYVAVAEVLAHVYRLRGLAAG